VLEFEVGIFGAYVLADCDEPERAVADVEEGDVAERDERARGRG